ncbi:hypothetical protein [Clostridium sp.]|uniref:hypothetical protein n=1 Tax=Clostridium sp. TaxID=1506 RepID=UPI0028445DA4|nr:hypothetical protein [Clostridium sp.]MDR3595429.1 hypothetical protein [Clostridium sp.]
MKISLKALDGRLHPLWLAPNIHFDKLKWNNLPSSAFSSLFSNAYFTQMYLSSLFGYAHLSIVKF